MQITQTYTEGTRVKGRWYGKPFTGIVTSCKPDKTREHHLMFVAFDTPVYVGKRSVCPQYVSGLFRTFIELQYDHWIEAESTATEEEFEETRACQQCGRGIEDCDCSYEHWIN